MTATFFVTAGFVERDDEVMTHLCRGLAHAPRPAPPAVVGPGARAARRGHVHRLAHLEPSQPRAPFDRPTAEGDLRRSREVLEERLRSRPRDRLSVGQLGRHVTDETFTAARRAGYELGLISLPRAVREADATLRVRGSAWAPSRSSAWPPRSPARSTGTATCTSACPLPSPAGSSPRMRAPSPQLPPARVPTRALSTRSSPATTTAASSARRSTASSPRATPT